jgi:acyl carrier protein
MSGEQRSGSPSWDVMTGDANLPSLEDIVTALKQSLAQIEDLHWTADEIDADVPLLAGGLDLDSIIIVELISRIEARFEFQFVDTDLRTRSFASLRALAQVVLYRLSQRTAG